MAKDNKGVFMVSAAAMRAALAIAAQKNNRALILELATEIDRETGLPDLLDAATAEIGIRSCYCFEDAKPCSVCILKKAIARAEGRE